MKRSNEHHVDIPSWPTGLRHPAPGQQCYRRYPTQHDLGSTLRRSLIAATLLTLSGCIETDLSLDISGITVTPLPSVFYISDVDDNGHRFPNASGKATINKVELRGDTYYVGEGKLRFVALNKTRNTFLLQATYPTYYAYGILRIRQDQMQILTFQDDNKFRNILKTADVKFVEHESTISFADKQQLLAGFQALENWFGDDAADITETFVPPDQLAHLQQLVDSANGVPAIAATITPSPTPSSSPTVQRYREAAEAGNTDAMNSLGVALAEGRGVPKNEAEATQWLHKAASAGNPSAMFNLAMTLDDGIGGAQDAFEATRWYRQAAEAGNLDAMFNLAKRLEVGRGGSKNEVEAISWLQKAAEAGEPDSMYELFMMIGDGRGTPKDNAMATHWLREAAVAGHVYAMSTLGARLAEGYGMPRNETEAVRWLRKAAAAGDAKAMYNLGVMLEAGRGTPQAASEAMQWLRNAANGGNTQAKERLGLVP